MLVIVEMGGREYTNISDDCFDGNSSDWNINKKEQLGSEN
jgi:hypothetical protein